MNDVAIKQERSEESTNADENNLPEAPISVTTESVAEDSSGKTVAEHHALTQIQGNAGNNEECGSFGATQVRVKPEPIDSSESTNQLNTMEDNLNDNAQPSLEDVGTITPAQAVIRQAQPADCSQGKEYCATSASQPATQPQVRVKPEPFDSSETTNQSNTIEDNLDNNAAASSARVDTTTPTHAVNATSSITTEPVASSSLDLENTETTSSLAGTRNGALVDAEQTAAQSVTEANIAAATASETVRVKPEPVSGIPETIPDDFFDDLLDNADQLTAELSPPPIDAPMEFSETTQAADSINNSTTTSERVRIKNEPPSLFERNVVPAGDELDNISTPSASPQRYTSNEVEETSSSAPTSAQVRVKNEVSQNMESSSYVEAIPENFFDDLLEDRVAARVARMENEFQEIKYSEKLKELKEKLRQLDEAEHDSDDARDRSTSSSGHHKHKSKKSKKHKEKSRKRDRSRERRKESSEDMVENGESRHSSSKRRRSHSRTEQRELGTETPQFNTNYGNLPKVPPPPSYTQTTANSTAHVEAEPDNAVYFPKPIMLKTEPAANFEPISLCADEDEQDDMDLECLPVPSTSKRAAVADEDAFSGFKKIKLEKPAERAQPLILTPAMKRQKALQLAAETMQKFHGAKHQSSFLFASTVRKLPNSSSYVTQQSYENRSPLHTIHNVRYTFNSHATRFNLHEWGLEALPKVAAKVARIVGCDADTLYAKLHSAKLSTKYNKIKGEPDDNSESIDESKSSFFTNAMTQTDDVYVLTSRRHNANDIGVQVTPISGCIGTQTTASSSSMTCINDDLPLMQLINVLNENQLLALNDFAELIREPAETAMDMYRLRTRMLEIYKCSQLPSALAEAPPISARVGVARTYEAAPRPLHKPADYRQPPQPPQYRLAARDPRASTSSSHYHPDLRAQLHPHLNPATIQQQSQYQGLPPQHSHLHPSAASAPTKNYGRGSTRR